MHSYGDSELVTGSVLAKQLGVSDMAVSKAKMSNRIDTFDDSKGRERYHPIVSAQQFRASRDRRHVTTATKGQRAAGLDDLAAQAVAFNKVYAIAAEAQEKIVSNYIVLAPKIAGAVQQLLVEGGFDEKPVRLALKSLEHTVGELIRKENLNSLRTFSEGMEKQEILE